MKRGSYWKRNRWRNHPWKNPCRMSRHLSRSGFRCGVSQPTGAEKNHPCGSRLSVVWQSSLPGFFFSITTTRNNEVLGVGEIAIVGEAHVSDSQDAYRSEGRRVGKGGR